MADSRIERLIGTDPTEWILASDEPYASWVALTRLEMLPRDDERVLGVQRSVVADPGVGRIVDDLPGWGELDDVPGHHSPKFLPNQLNLLADMGVRAGDFERVDALLEGFLGHEDKAGRFESLGKAPGHPDPAWGSLLCDTNVITYLLMRYNLDDSEGVERAIQRILKDVAKTPQGRAWQCIPQTTSRWRGPGRKADVCPQVTLEGLRVLSRLPADERPDWTLDAARTPLEVWRRRGDERPYSFGHGYQFKSVKWPNYWYDVLWALETLCRFPDLWVGPDARDDDREALAELAACLIAYNIDPDGRVTPRRTYRGFERFSFGQKTDPSPFATARTLAALVPLADLADEIAAVEIETLPSSKGGSGTAMPPKNQYACPVPPSARRFPAEQAMPRVLARHHIGVPWVHASVDSVVADIVGLHATSQTGPYAALFARLPGFEKGALDRALYERHSLVRWRSMRGTVFIVRRDLLPAIATATHRQVVKYARDYARYRGVTDEVVEAWAPRILELAHEIPLTTAGYRERLGDADLDVATLVTLMATKGQLVRGAPPGGWLDRRWTYAATEDVLPEFRLDAMSEEDADADVTRAYLRAFGPATLGDASWWTGLGAKRIGRAVQALGDEVEEVALAGSDAEYLIHTADVDELGAATLTERPAVALLPSLDPLIMGFTDRSRYLDEMLRPYVFDRAGNSTNVVLVDGRIAGVWDVTPEPTPRVLIRMLVATDPIWVSIIEERAAALGTFWFDEPADVAFVGDMVPLTERTAGSIMKPLR